MPLSSKDERLQMLLLSHSGLDSSDIAFAVGRKERTVNKWLSRFSEHGHTESYHKGNSGRPRATTQEQDIDVLADCIANPFKPAKKIFHELHDELSCSYTTIRNRLSEYDRKSYRAAQKLLLTEQHKRDRYEFCNNYD